MKTTVNLDNNYYLEIINNNDNTKGAIDVKKISPYNIVKEKIFLIKIDFNSIYKKEYKKILRKLLLIKNIISKTKISIGINKNSKILLGYIINYDEVNKQQYDFIAGINAIFYSTRYERYNYIYDKVCDYLDSYFYGKNLCEFKDNKCGEKKETLSDVGCCRHFKRKWMGPLSKLVICEYLEKDYSCTAKCISCKLFTCDYLQKKGIRFKIKDILLLDTFFNPIQKYFIKYMVFTPKEKILKRLIKL